MPFRLVSFNQSSKIVKPISTYTNNELVELYESAKTKQTAELVQLVEREGRKRQIIYFLTQDEQLELCKSIFGEETHWADGTNGGKA